MSVQHVFDLPSKVGGNIIASSSLCSTVLRACSRSPAAAVGSPAIAASVLSTSMACRRA